MKNFFGVCLLCLWASNSFAADSITGLWTTIDDETGAAKSVVQIYDYQGKLYGRVVKLFKNPQAKAKNIAGSPQILGLDILWNLVDQGAKFGGGKVLDPVKGKIYSSEAWLDNGNLILRGKIGPFGRNQTWHKNEDDSLKIKNPIPSIPEKE